MIDSKKRLDADALKFQAQGRWLDIFQALCPGMFDAAIKHLGTHVTCPFHGGENDFRFIKKSTRSGRGNTRDEGVAMCTCGFYPDGLAVIRRATGWSFPETLKQVDEYLNGFSVQPAPVFVPVIKESSPEDDAARIAAILARVNGLWAAGKGMDATYYVSRGIDPRILDEVLDIRFLPSLGYYQTVDGELTKIGSYPANLVLMRDPKGNPVAVHRTWLSKDLTDKAPVLNAKKLSQTTGVSGGAMRIFDASGSDVLGLAEGVESALGVRQLSAGRYWPELGKVPVWPCYSAGNIEAFIIPEDLLKSLRKIVVFADNDENGRGLKAADTFKERMGREHPEIEVVIKLPLVMGWDWLDVLVNL